MVLNNTNNINNYNTCTTINRNKNNKNININNSLGDSLFKSTENDNFETSKSNSFLNMKKENFVLNPINCDDNHNERNRVIENNLLNSLFFIKMKLLEKKNTVKSRTFIEEIEGREDIITEKRKQCSGLFNYNDDSYDNFFELDEIENFNETFLIKGKRENQEAMSKKSRIREYNQKFQKFH